MEKTEVNVNPNDRLRYYTAFLNFLYAVGEHQAAVKLRINVEDGVYQAQKVAYEYNLRGAKLDQTIYERNLVRWDAFDMLDRWSQTVGLKGIDPKDSYKVMQFFENYDNRRYVRDNVRRAIKKGELLSVADFMNKRYGIIRKRREKEQQAGD